MVAIGSAARSGSAIGNFYGKVWETDYTDVKPYVLVLASPAQAHVTRLRAGRGSIRALGVAFDLLPDPQVEAWRAGRWIPRAKGSNCP